MKRQASRPVARTDGSVRRVARTRASPAVARPRLKRLTRQESRARTREQLLASAREVFGSVGYENASIDLIAETAGYSKGAYYSNFDTKEEIFLELLETHSSQDVPEIAALLEGVDDPIEMIDVISNWAASGSRDPAWGVMALEVLRRARQDKTFSARHAKLFRSQWQGLGKILLRMFPDGKAPATPEVLGALVFELTYGASSAFTDRPGVGTLVKVALTALYLAHGKR